MLKIFFSEDKNRQNALQNEQKENLNEKLMNLRTNDRVGSVFQKCLLTWVKIH